MRLDIGRARSCIQAWMPFFDYSTSGLKLPQYYLQNSEFPRLKKGHSAWKRVYEGTWFLALLAGQKWIRDQCRQLNGVERECSVPSDDGCGAAVRTQPNTVTFTWLIVPEFTCLSQVYKCKYEHIRKAKMLSGQLSVLCTVIAPPP